VNVKTFNKTKTSQTKPILFCWVTLCACQRLSPAVKPFLSFCYRTFQSCQIYSILTIAIHYRSLYDTKRNATVTCDQKPTRVRLIYSTETTTNYRQEAQLSPRDRAMRRVSWNLANCHATVQKLLVRKVLNKSKFWNWRFSWRQCVINMCTQPWRDRVALIVL